jgi:hypothetical protein
MKYSYLGFPNKDPQGSLICRPFLVVRLAHNNQSANTFCLVDSGADVCLMPASIGRLIGIDLESGAEDVIRGIANQQAKTYRHLVHITVPKLASFDTSVAFSHDIKYGILGQEGFFERFRVTFDRKKLQFEVIDI